MTARRIRESYEGGSIVVKLTKVMGRSFVSVNTHEHDAMGDGEDDRDALVYLTPAETAELVGALNAALAELATQNTRPSASPVAEGRVQTAAKTAGAAPTDNASGSPLDGGHTRTTAAGPSTASGPGRPTCDDCSPFLCICGAVPGDELFVNELVVTEAEPPNDMTDPDEPIGNLTGGNYHESAAQAAVTSDERAGIAWALADARAELLANSTPLGPAGGAE